MMISMVELVVYAVGLVVTVAVAAFTAGGIFQKRTRNLKDKAADATNADETRQKTAATTEASRETARALDDNALDLRLRELRNRK